MSFRPYARRAVSAVSLLLLSVLVSRSYSQSDQAIAREKANVLIFPDTLLQANSKFPSSASFILIRKNCPSNSGLDFDPNAGVNVSVAGPAGITISNPTVVSPCKIVGTLTIDTDKAIRGFYVVSIIQNKSDKGYAILTLADGAPIPTPTPQVDVIWGVQSEKMCKANFGRNISNKLYCIEVKIGNNTGHQLQLAGIGFQSFTSLKVIPGSISPGIGEPADTKVVPNGSNEQTATTYPITTPNIGYQSVRTASLELSTWDTRNLLYNGAFATGILMASFNPFFHNVFSNQRWTAGTGVVGTAIPAAVDRMDGDPTIRHLNALDDQAFRDGKLIPNNTQIRTVVFVERAAFKGFGGQTYLKTCTALYATDKDALKNCQKKGDDPTAIKVGLGKLIIVGDTVDYVQRLVVDSTVTSQEVTPGQQLRAATAVANSTAITASISGLSTLTNVSAVLHDNKAADQTKADVPLTLDASASDLTMGKVVFNSSAQIKEGGSYSITITTASQQKLGPKDIQITPAATAPPK